MTEPMAKKRILSALLSLCMALALFAGFGLAAPITAHAAAGDLYVLGGGGGQSTFNHGYGGQGGAVVDGTFWASGGGGGGSGDTVGIHLGLDGGAGTEGNGGSGGNHNPAPNTGTDGGHGGNGNNSSASVNAGSTNSGSNGGAGGGYTNENYVNGTYTATGGDGGIQGFPCAGGNGGNAALNIGSGTYTTVVVTGGVPGNDAGGTVGAGGSATLNVTGTLTAPAITVTQPSDGGTASASISTLLVAAGGTTVTNNGGTVTITTIKFDTTSTSLSVTGAAGVTNINLVPPATANGGSTGFSLTGISSGTLSIDTSNLSLSTGESITLLTMSGGVPAGWNNQTFGDYKTEVSGTNLLLNKPTPNHDPITPPDPNTPLDLSKDMIVAFNGDYTNLARVLLNGQEMPQSVVSAVESTLGWSSYSGDAGNVKEGSVVVTLYKEFLQWLPNGVYSLEVEFNDGGVVSSGTADFLIQRAASPTPAPTQDPTPAGGSPQTGDSSNLPLWALCGGLALAGLCGCGAVVYRRKRQHGKAS